uniref:YfhO family protein n=1 Tax=Latilactobacillus fuchuensis TaxID=164393 RepID=UPI0039B11A38
DSYTQYSIFYKALRQMLLNHQSLLYSFKLGLGGNFFSIISYYLASPLSLFVVFFQKQQILLFMTLMIYIKLILAGLTFYSYLYKLQGHQIRNIMFACMYALMSYNLIYAFNLMWLDSIIILPIALICVERLIHDQKIGGLVFTLMLLFVTNFYSAYITGIGIFIYFIAMLIIQKSQKVIKTIVTFFYAVLLSAGLSMWIVLPTYLGLKTGPKTGVGLTSLIQRKESIWETLSNVFAYNPNFFSGAVIYAGIIPLILLGVFLLSKKNSLKVKVVVGTISVIFLLSYLFECPYVAWHGFQQPTGFGFRFGFLVSVLLILVANNMLTKIDRTDFKSILIVSFVLICVVSVLGYKKSISIEMLFANILLIVIGTSCFLILLKKNTVNKTNLLQLLLLVMAIFDIGLNAKFINQQFYKMPGYTTAAKSWVTEDSDMVNKDLNYIDQDQLFSRVAMQPNNLLNQGLLYDFNGMSWFNTFGYQETARFLNQMGYSTSLGNKSLSYQNGNTIVDTFLGLKYRIIPKNETNTNIGYQKAYEAGQYSVYCNKNSLPLGWINKTQLTPNRKLSGNTFENQALLLGEKNRQALDSATNRLAEQHNVKVNHDNGNAQIEPIGKDAYVVYTVQVPKKSELNMRITSIDGANSYAKMDLQTDQVKVENFPNYHNEGNLSIYYNKGEMRDINVKLYVRGPVNISGNPQFYSLKQHMFEETIGKTQKVNLKIAKNNDGLINGKITLKNKAPLFLSVPYDPSWRATVNQKSTKIINNHGFSQINLSSGINSIQLKFEPKGLKIGLLISLLTIGWLVIAGVWGK